MADPQLEIPQLSLGCELDASDRVTPVDLGGSPLLLSGQRAVVTPDLTRTNNFVVDLSTMGRTDFPDGLAVQVAGPGLFLFAEWTIFETNFFLTDGLGYRRDLARVEGGLSARRTLRKDDQIFGQEGEELVLIRETERVLIEQGESVPDSFGEWSGWIDGTTGGVVVMDPDSAIHRISDPPAIEVMAYPSGVLSTHRSRLSTFTNEGQFTLWERPAALFPAAAGAFAFALVGPEGPDGAFLVAGQDGLLEMAVPAHVALPLSAEASKDWIIWSAVLGEDACPRRMGLYAAAIEDGAPLLWLGSDSTDCAEAGRPAFLIGEDDILIVFAKGGSARVRTRDLPRRCSE
ncbi:MAG: hypothetical protein IPG45_14275 [Deltaproteobacteria bacterium]|nr:hypothetical protein [Deltaproteobacteria bacterium]